MDTSIWSLQFWTQDSEHVRNLVWTLATLIGLPVLIVRALANRAAARAATRQATTAERGKLSDRFTAAIADLASENESNRLGAIFALGALCLETEELHWSIMDNLAAHVRRNRPAQSGFRGLVPIDVQQALRVLGSRPERYRKQDRVRRWSLDLSKIDLSGICLRECCFSGANLSGTVMPNADFSGTDFTGADMSGVQLSNTNLRGARLTKANLRGSDMSYCNLRKSCPSSANLWGANLTGALMGDADLIHSLMWGTTLRGASMIGVNLQGALLGEANLENTVITKYELSGACVLGATFEAAG